MAMRAVVLEEFGGPLTMRRSPAHPRSGQVLVRIAASGVNPLDTKIRAGKAAHARSVLPAVLGLDLAGVVEEVGADVTGFAPGDEVFGMTGGVGDLQGSLAEYAAVDARLLARKPADLTMRQAAALPLVFITAWEGLVDRAGVHTGQKVLVHGGAGGIGHVAVQLARARGAQVFATGSPRSLETIAAPGRDADRLHLHVGRGVRRRAHRRRGLRHRLRHRRRSRHSTRPSPPRAPTPGTW